LKESRRKGGEETTQYTEKEKRERTSLQILKERGKRERGTRNPTEGRKNRFRDNKSIKIG